MNSTEPTFQHRSTTLELVFAHEFRTRQSLSLVASENASSFHMHRVLASDLHHRYCIPPKANATPASGIIRIRNTTGKSPLKPLHWPARSLGRNMPIVRPLYGNQVSQIILMSLVKPGGTV